MVAKSAISGELYWNRISTPAIFRTRYASRIRRFSRFRFTARLKNLFGTLIKIRHGRSLTDVAVWSAVGS